MRNPPLAAGEAIPPPSTTSASSDGSLVRQLRQGHLGAATQIYLRYAHRLRALAKAKCPQSLARHLDPEDIVQSVFRRFFRRASQGHYEVPRGEDLWRLFLVIALNKIRAESAFHHTAKRDVRLTVGGNSLDQVDGAKQAEADPAWAFLQLTVDEALQRLPPAHRAMITLRIEGYEVHEIADKTGRSKRTVERVLQDSRKKLGVFLHGQE
jgi:RNA polymerase sigma-70 factor, ECF subfamily